MSDAATSQPPAMTHDSGKRRKRNKANDALSQEERAIRAESGRQRQLAALAPTQWQKGVSGHAAGRPPMPAALRQEAVRACPEALAVVLELLHDKEQSGTVRLGAAEFVWNRALGRPEQSVSVAVDPSTNLALDLNAPALAALLALWHAAQARHEIDVTPAPVAEPEKP